MQSKLKATYFLTNGEKCSAFFIYRDGHSMVREYNHLTSYFEWDDMNTIDSSAIDIVRDYYRSLLRKGYVRKMKREIWKK